MLGTLEGCREALSEALDQHYYAGASHLFGVTAIALSLAGDAQTGARLVGAMIENGHLPRRIAQRELEAALGDDLAIWSSSDEASESRKPGVWR